MRQGYRTPRAKRGQGSGDQYDSGDSSNYNGSSNYDQQQQYEEEQQQYREEQQQRYQHHLQDEHEQYERYKHEEFEKQQAEERAKQKRIDTRDATATEKVGKAKIDNGRTGSFGGSGTAQAASKTVEATPDVTSAAEDAAAGAGGSTIEANAAAGRAAEAQNVADRIAAGYEHLGNQITIRAGGEDGVRFRIDSAFSKDGQLVLDEVKASQTAPLTANQAEGFPILESEGRWVRPGSASFAKVQGFVGKDGTLPAQFINIVRYG